MNTYVSICGGKIRGTTKFERHRYWEIVGELTWRGADRNQSIDAAKWCYRAEPGSEKSISVNGHPAIMLKVK